MKYEREGGVGGGKKGRTGKKVRLDGERFG